MGLAVPKTHVLLLRGAIKRAVLAIAGISAALATDAAITSTAAESAVVFMYHRFGESAYPSTNVSIAQFEAHIAELKNGNYAVRPLPEIIRALRAGRNLPDRTVALSIDDAFQSIYTEAWPRLKKAGLPFTIFVSTDPVDQEKSGYMNWAQIAELVRSGLVTIGNHTASHLHMAASSEQRNTAEIAKSNARFRAKLGSVPKLIAYPYGEYSLAVRKVVSAAGFDTAFGDLRAVRSPYSRTEER